MKAGGASLPLSPEYPQQRLAWMAADGEIKVLLTQEHLRAKVAAETAKVVVLDGEAQPWAQESATTTESRVKEENLAYVIYTSGSTGMPKGVMVTQGGLSNYLQWSREAYRMEEGEGAPVFSPLGFDLTVTSLLGPLVSGRRVDMFAGEQDVRELKERLQAGVEYSVVKATPGHLQMLEQSWSEEGEPGEVQGRVGVLVVGGEALSGKQLRWWTRNAPQTGVVNEYGPTETVVGCCVYAMEAGKMEEGACAIGKEIGNSSVS